MGQEREGHRGGGGGMRKGGAQRGWGLCLNVVSPLISLYLSLLFCFM